ncbi:hypothetical protein C0991_001415 [Blastosporella zonata]|nr:hypothetical protein C0991_001415 [Blastosporella zonata]
MKFFASIISASLFIAVAMAQNISIIQPSTGSSFTQGRRMTVQVMRSAYTPAPTEVGCVIAVASCQTGTCPDPKSQIGSVLYTGQFSEFGDGEYDDYQNFNVTIPAGFPLGPAQLTVTRFFLTGAGPTPTTGDALVALNIRQF